MEAFHEGFQYVPSEFFSYLMTELCCMVTSFPTDGSLKCIVNKGVCLIGVAQNAILLKNFPYLSHHPSIWREFHY